MQAIHKVKLRSDIRVLFNVIIMLPDAVERLFNYLIVHVKLLLFEVFELVIVIRVFDLLVVILRTFGPGEVGAVTSHVRVCLFLFFFWGLFFICYYEARNY